MVGGSILKGVPMENSIVRCEHCGRQFVSANESTDKTISKSGAVCGLRAPICRECGIGLDDNGNYPDEY